MTFIYFITSIPLRIIVKWMLFDDGIEKISDWTESWFDQ